LKKQKVPFVVFEGSTRLGGRIKTVYNLNASGDSAELGGEWILPEHSQLRQLCHDLRIELTESIFQDDKQSANKLRSIMRTFSLKKSDSAHLLRLNSLSLAEYLERESFAVSQRNLLITVAELRFGISATDIPAQVLFDSFESKSAPFLPLSSKLYRCAGGSASLVEALRENIEGVIPKRQLQLQTKLLNIERQDGLYILSFSTPEGRRSVKAKHVILAMPNTLVKQLPGIANLGLDEELLKQFSNIQIGHIGKGILVNNDKSKQPLAEKYLNSNTGIFYHRNHSSLQAAIGASTIWNFQMGGEKARKLGLDIAKDLHSDFSSVTADQLQVFNWTLNPWSEGSRSYTSMKSVEKGEANLVNTEKSTMQFAGEYVSQNYQGTMNGAIESGEKAAQNIIRLISNNAIS
jgi:monoamine oxidase